MIQQVIVLTIAHVLRLLPSGSHMYYSGVHADILVFTISEFDLQIVVVCESFRFQLLVTPSFLLVSVICEVGCSCCVVYCLRGSCTQLHIIGGITGVLQILQNLV